MSEKINLDGARRETLDRIERAERRFKLMFYLAAAWEAIFLIAFLLAADFSNRTHVLLLIATIGSYTMVIFGLFALGAHVNRAVLRVLKAIELSNAR